MSETRTKNKNNKHALAKRLEVFRQNSVWRQNYVMSVDRVSFVRCTSVGIIATFNRVQWFHKKTIKKIKKKTTYACFYYGVTFSSFYVDSI